MLLGCTRSDCVVYYFLSVYSFPFLRLFFPFSSLFFAFDFFFLSEHFLFAFWETAAAAVAWLNKYIFHKTQKQNVKGKKQTAHNKYLAVVLCILPLAVSEMLCRRKKKPHKNNPVDGMSSVCMLTPCATMRHTETHMRRLLAHCTSTSASPEIKTRNCLLFNWICIYLIKYNSFCCRFLLLLRLTHRQIHTHQ